MRGFSRKSLYLAQQLAWLSVGTAPTEQIGKKIRVDMFLSYYSPILRSLINTRPSGGFRSHAHFAKPEDAEAFAQRKTFL
jgi:hypothetical protein